MDLFRLERRDHARSLVDLVYATYGLTFHRDWMYNPDRMLELNKLGDITSFIAVENGEVIGHLAMIRPHFEVETESGPVSSEGVRETGLAIVHPKHRGKGVQVALAMGLAQVAHEMGIRGSIMRCVTQHTYSQRGALAMGGQPTALLLGSIPRWVSYDFDDPSKREPLSTVLHWVPVHPVQDVSALVQPPGMEWFQSALSGIGEQRIAPPSSALLPSESELVANWSGSRRLANVHVTRIGRDLVDRLSETCNWLVKGHIAHISVFLPGDVPALATMHNDLSALGLFPAGFIPGYLRGGRDALVYQALEWADLKPERIKVVGDAAAEVRRSVLEGWRSVSGRSAREQERKCRLWAKKSA